MCIWMYFHIMTLKWWGYFSVNLIFFCKNAYQIAKWMYVNNVHTRIKIEEKWILTWKFNLKHQVIIEGARLFVKLQCNMPPLLYKLFWLVAIFFSSKVMIILFFNIVTLMLFSSSLNVIIWLTSLYFFFAYYNPS